MNLHHLFVWYSRTDVHIVHILRDQEELMGVFGQSRDRRMSCIRLCIADALPALAIPFPNQFRIARESFRRRQLCRIKVPPVTVFATKSRDSAFGGNASACQNEKTHNVRSTGNDDFQIAALSKFERV